MSNIDSEDSLLSTAIAEHVKPLVPQDGSHPTKISGLSLVRISRAPGTRYMTDAARICYVVQGSKAIFHGGGRHVYDSSKLLVLPVNIPLAGQIIDAKPSRPMISISMSLDLGETR